MIIYLELSCVLTEKKKTTNFLLEQDKIQDISCDHNPEGRLQDLFKQRIGILHFMRCFITLGFMSMVEIMFNKKMVKTLQKLREYR